MSGWINTRNFFWHYVPDPKVDLRSIDAIKEFDLSQFVHKWESKFKKQDIIFSLNFSRGAKRLYETASSAFNANTITMFVKFLDKNMELFYSFELIGGLIQYFKKDCNFHLDEFITSEDISFIHDDVFKKNKYRLMESLVDNICRWIRGAHLELLLEYLDLNSSENLDSKEKFIEVFNKLINSLDNKSITIEYLEEITSTKEITDLFSNLLNENQKKNLIRVIRCILGLIYLKSLIRFTWDKESDTKPAIIDEELIIDTNQTPDFFFKCQRNIDMMLEIIYQRMRYKKKVIDAKQIIFDSGRYNLKKDAIDTIYKDFITLYNTCRTKEGKKYTIFSRLADFRLYLYGLKVKMLQIENDIRVNYQKGYALEIHWDRNFSDRINITVDSIKQYIRQN